MEWINLKDIYLNFYSRRVTKLNPMLLFMSGSRLDNFVQFIFKLKCVPYTEIPSDFCF
jgi:hypothetical protein